MPLQNRVTPDGCIIEVPSRGTWMGNRGGCLHDEHRRLHPTRRWINRHWLICQLTFKDRHREVMAPRRYTELFFLDEVTALAAGHRPCVECRRESFNRFADLWRVAVAPDDDERSAVATGSRPRVAEIDDRLHRERWAALRCRTHPPTGCEVATMGTLPAGAMVWWRDSPWALWGAGEHRNALPLDARRLRRAGDTTCHGIRVPDHTASDLRGPAGRIPTRLASERHDIRDRHRVRLNGRAPRRRPVPQVALRHGSGSTLRRPRSAAGPWRSGTPPLPSAALSRHSGRGDRLC